MERFSKCKLLFAAIRRNHSTAIISKPPGSYFTHPLPLIPQPKSSIPFHNFTRSRGFSSFSYFRETFSHWGHLKKFFSPKIVFLGLGLSGVVLYLYFLDWVPYTHRKRILIYSDDVSRKVGKVSLQDLKEDEIVPATDPRSVRICSILRKLLDAVYRDLGLNETPVVTYSGVSESNPKGIAETSFRRTISWGRTDISHLKGKNWQVVVVNKPEFGASTSGEGIIIVYTGMLNGLSDIQVATILAQMVGHCVARHFAETLSLMLKNFLYLLFLGFLFNPHQNFVTFQRRVLTEADYISLLLMAAAGYDPHEVVQVHQMLERFYRTQKDSVISIEERIQHLSQPHVMEEALAIYRLATGSN